MTKRTARPNRRTDHGKRRVGIIRLRILVPGADVQMTFEILDEVR
jgi:hypothetical protein